MQKKVISKKHPQKIVRVQVYSILFARFENKSKVREVRLTKVRGVRISGNLGSTQH